jgi:hypothetical protein
VLPPRSGLPRAINRHEHLDALLERLRGCFRDQAGREEKPGCPSQPLSGHSLRAGFVTEAKKHGAEDAAIMDAVYRVKQLHFQVLRLFSSLQDHFWIG